MASDKNTAAAAKNPLLSVVLGAKNISIDFDGTLISTSRRFYWLFASSNSLLPQTPFFIWAEKLFTSLTSGYSKKPLDCSLETLKMLKDRGASLKLLTSRRTHLEELTKSWLSRYGFIQLFDEFLFNKKSLHPFDHKISTLKENPSIQVHVDDSKKAVLALSSKLPDRTFVWICKAYPEKERGLNLPNVIEIDSWAMLISV